MDLPYPDEFSAQVADHLFHQYPEFAAHASVVDGMLRIEAPMPSGDGTILVVVCEEPRVVVGIKESARTQQDFTDPEPTFAYIEQLRQGARVHHENWDPWECGGESLEWWRYQAPAKPVLGFRFAFETQSGRPQEVIEQMAFEMLAPRELMLDYTTSGTHAIGFIVSENPVASMTEVGVNEVRGFLSGHADLAHSVVLPLTSDAELADAELSLLDSEHGDVGESALLAIASHARLHNRRPHFAELLAKVCECTTAEHPRTRARATQAIAALAGARGEFAAALATLLPMAEDPEPEVRGCLAASCGHIPAAALSTDEAERLLGVLLALTEDSDQNTVTAAALSATLFTNTPAMGRRVLERLLQLANTDETRGAALQALIQGVDGAARIAPVLIKIFQDTSLPMPHRVGAVQTLGRYAEESSDALEVLSLAMREESADLLAGALRGAQLVTERSQFEPILIARSRSLDSGIRIAAYETMAALRFHSEGVAEALRVGVQDLDPTVAEKARAVWQHLFAR